MMKAFVIMPFDKRFARIFFECIRPACKRLGIDAIRADETHEPGKIIDQIIRLIKDSLFVIADISQKNDNVFYELGYAHALNKDAVLLSNNTRPLPFDVRADRVILYDRKNNRWSEELSERISGAIEQLYKRSKRILLNDIDVGREFKGHMHTVSGRLFNIDPFKHFWFFAKREDLDVYWPQDSGEVVVCSDGSWKAQLFLGVADRPEDMSCFYDVKFGLVHTVDNRDLMRFCIECAQRNSHPGMRQLPTSFEELAHIKVRRI